MLDNITLSTIIIGIVVSMLRSLTGYLEQCLKDGKEPFSWMKLGETVMRVLPQAIGIEALIPGASAGALLTDYIVSKVATKKK